MTGSATSLAGRIADRYDIERELGHGGTAVVYLARDTRDGTAVALKVLREELTASVAAERFLREIRLNERLTHASILPVLDSGKHEGRLYFVLPYMEGGTLRDRLERERQLPLNDAVAITRTVATALTYAHSQGLIHRDVKPENILFTGGQARLGDFGIARALEKSIEDSTTTTGIVRGTPPYMSPEQASGEGSYDGRSDTYSLGCVVYEMLAGMLPYVGPTQESIIAQKMVHPPRPLRVYRPSMPQAVEDTIGRALALAPADRFQSATGFVDALESASTMPASHAYVTAERRVAKRWWSVGAVAMVSAALILWRLTSADGATLDPNRVMVFPLAATGGDGSTKLGEDAASMIGSVLDGAGPLRTVDAWPLLEPGLRDTIRKVTARIATAIATAHHSGRYVTGRIVVAADSAFVFLDVRDTHGDSAVAHASAAGLASDVWRLTLRAVNEILPRVIPGVAVDGVSGWEDRNPQAIASFLQGESAFRRAQFAEALEHYHRAVRVDSLFALAAIRGAQSAAWRHKPEEAAVFVKAAMRSDLPKRYLHLARGYGAYNDGHADSAVAELRAAVAEDPRMAVAWTQLGEVYTHLMPARGNPDALAAEAFGNALALDSNAVNNLFHSTQIALRRGDLAAAEPMLRRFLAVQPETTLARNLEIAGNCARHGVSGTRWEEHARQRPLPLLLAGVSLAAGGANFPCATRAFAAVLAGDTAKNDDADGRRWSALVGLQGALLALGRSHDAAAAIDAYNSRWGYGASLFLLAAPLDSVMAARANDIARSDSARYGPRFEKLSFAFRFWELGQFRLQQGQVDVAAHMARELDARATKSRDPLERVLAQSLAARVALARADTATARTLLTTIVPTKLPAAQNLWHEMAAAPGERLLLARLQLASRDYEQAIATAEVIESPGAAIHPMYLPASLALRLEAANATGDRRLQTELRRRIAELRSP